MNKSPPIKLAFSGNVPSFKNTKMIARGRLITDPRKQKIMAKITDSFVSQLRSWCQTNGIGTGTESFRRALTAGLLPLDDSLKWIGLSCVGWRKVSKGQEGVEIEITTI